MVITDVQEEKTEYDIFRSFKVNKAFELQNKNFV